MSARPLDVLACPLAGVRLIEASAGTGKTWNICALVLRLLVERRLGVAQILVVTFTNAATAELRERVRTRIVELREHLRGAAAPDALIRDLGAAALQAWPRDALVAHLDLALASFDEAAIFTIHGFCQRALGDAPFSAGVAPPLEVLEDDGDLRRAVVNDFWRTRVAAADPALLDLLRARGDTPQTFDRLLRRHLAQPLAALRWPDDIDAPDRRGDGAALAAAHATAHRLWREAREAIVALLLQPSRALNANIYNAATVALGAAAWDELLADEAPAGPGAEEPKKAELFASSTLRARTNRGKTTPAHPFFDAAEAVIEARARRRETLERARLRLLRDLLAHGAQALREGKRERRVVAFDDLLFNLWQRLHGKAAPGLAAQLRARFPAALIDEFQDTDPLQLAIFRAIYAGADATDAPLFLVGDPKQAIYRFRNADLHAYLGARSLARTNYTLLANQRSSQGLIDALNALFGANPAAFMLPGLDYRPLGVGAKRPAPFADHGPPAAPFTVWTLPAGEDGAPLRKAEARRAAIAATAAEIVRLLGAARRGGITIGARPLAAGDIAVLVRSHAQGRMVRRALAALGVGSVELSQDSVFASVDAEELERVLAAVLEPAREVLLRAALSTALLGADAAAIAALGEQAALLLEKVQGLARYRETWRTRGIGVMLREWLAGERVAERLLARSDGERRLTNLLHLAEQLHRASHEHAAPEALLRWLQAERRGDRADEAAQLRLESDRDLVQIVTVHKSKGLEYGIVFCPLLWEVPARRDAGLDGVAYHDDGGDLVIDFRPDGAPGFGADAVTRRVELEDAAEDLRLLYVALTRAVHRCTIVAGSYLKSAGRATSAKESGRSLLNWLVAGAGISPEDWLEGERTPQAIAAGWDALAARAGNALAVVALPAGRATPLAVEAGRPDEFTARAAPSIAPPWRIGSYSGLAHGAAADRAVADHDLRAVAAEAAPEADVTAEDILRFPRGAAAGECLHAVLERIDFADPAGWPEAIGAALRRHGPALASRGVPEADALNARRLGRMLDDVLHTPLPVGTRSPLVLADLPRSRRIAELEFHLPVRCLDAGALGQLLVDGGVRAPRLSFAPLSGFVTGFVDLVLEHDGRVFLIDWKSNHLGSTPERYAGEPLAEAMTQHGYHLQALLYSVAVRRWLRRHGPGAPEFGGAIYLFVRGVRPGWKTPAGAPSGVHFVAPANAVLARFEALLDGAEAS